MPTGLVRPYKTVALTSGSWTPIEAPDYPIKGYYIWTASESGVSLSHNTDGDDPVFVPGSMQPFPNGIHVATSEADIEYVQSEAATDTLNIKFVPLEQQTY